MRNMVDKLRILVCVPTQERGNERKELLRLPAAQPPALHVRETFF